jgi:hypothetical protein
MTGQTQERTMNRMSLIGAIFAIAFLAPNMALAACEVGISSNSTTTKSCTTSDISNLRRSVELQASAGVFLVGENGPTGGSLEGQITVASCHEDGSAGYYGDTGGGSVQENADYNATSNCGSGQTYSDISS